MRHPIRGLLIGPMVAPVAYWIGVVAYAWVSDFRLDWFQALRELMMIAAFGLPIAYAATLVWGAPILYALHRLGWLRAAPLIAAGAVGGTIVAPGAYASARGCRARRARSGRMLVGRARQSRAKWAGHLTQQQLTDCRHRAIPPPGKTLNSIILMFSRRFPFLTALCVGLIAGVGYPFVDVGLACRAPASEACVWGKAYFPLTLGISVVLIGGAVTALLYAVLIWRRRRQSRDDAA